MKDGKWQEPYLESCCRSALHRLRQSAAVGRPRKCRDTPCLERLTTKHLASRREDGRYVITAAGVMRHKQEVLKHAVSKRAEQPEQDPRKDNGGGQG